MLTIYILDKFYNVFANLGEHNASETDYIINEIYQFMHSRKRENMLTGEKYYVGNHDILYRQRMAIGEGGELKAIDNLPNNRIVNNQYAKAVDQKVNYLMGRAPTITADNERYSDLLNEFLGTRFRGTLKHLGEDALNCGIAWLLIHYDEHGELVLKRIRPIELIPGWRDAEHTILDFAIRIYPVLECVGTSETVSYRVEVFDHSGIHYFEYDGNLTPCEPFHEPYFTMDGQGYNWDRIPLVAFKYNSKEIPLINKVKTLQDGLNVMLSDFENNMQEDARNTILVLENYAGEDLGEFRRNLATYGAVNIETSDGGSGGLSTLKIEVNPENYRLIFDLLKKALIENAMSFDAKDDRMSTDPNQMNIQSMYSDIDLDANSMETEFQIAMEQVFWFIKAHFANTGQGDFGDEKAKIIFNRDVLINESEKINNIRASDGLISRETQLAHHPYVDDVKKELARVKAEEAERMAQMDYANLEMPPTTPQGGDTGDDAE